MGSTRVSKLAVLGLMLLSVSCNDDPLSPRFTAEEPFSLSTEVTTQEAFRWEGINGEITVTGSSSALQVTVTGVRRVEADSQEEADDRLPDIAVDLTTAPDEVLIRVEHPQSGPGWNYIVDCSIVVPRFMAITILNGNGSVDLDGASGGVGVTVGNGSITTRNVLGDMVLIVGNGGIDGQATLLSGSAVRAEAGNGNVELRVPKETSAMVNAAVGNGLITVSGLILFNRVQDQQSLTGRLGAGDGSIALSAGNGNVALRGS